MSPNFFWIHYSQTETVGYNISVNRIGKGSTMIHFDYAVQAMESRGFEPEELDEDRCIAMFTIQTKRGPLTVGINDQWTVAYKPNGTKKRGSCNTDSRFTAWLDQMLAWNN